MRRAAVLVGCLYRRPPYELQGCINDVSHMRTLLINRFDFQDNNIEVLSDDGTHTTPTKENIMKALNQMIDNAGRNDVLFFFFSGYGTSFGNQHAIVPLDAINTMDALDGNYLITSHDFRKLVNRLPLGATFTIVADSGHSGVLIAGEQLKIVPPNAPIDHHNVQETMISKSISPDTTPSPIMGTSGTDGGILLSASKPDGTAFEIIPARDRSAAYGAFTGAIREVLAANLRPIKNYQLVTGAWNRLNRGCVDQYPCLYCSDGNVDAFFLSQSEGEQH